MYVMRQFVQSAELILRHLNEVKSVQQEGKKCRNELSNIEKSLHIHVYDAVTCLLNGYKILVKHSAF